MTPTNGFSVSTGSLLPTTNVDGPCEAAGEALGDALGELLAVAALTGMRHRPSTTADAAIRWRIRRADRQSGPSMGVSSQVRQSVVG